MNKNRILCAVLFAILCVPSLRVRAGDDVEGVTVQDKKVYAIRGDKQDVLTENLKLPFDVEVNTNGTFKVADGKERKIAEGQVVRRDGWLLNPDGSLQPVFDHVAMKAGRVYLVRDGQSAAITTTLVLSNGMSVGPDGSCGSNPYSGQSRLLDGELYRLNGVPVPTKDTVTMKNGRVVVQKGGTLIPLAPIQMMGMSDGTRVFGSGAVQKPDGTTIQLREGQTVLVEGAIYRR